MVTEYQIKQQDAGVMNHTVEERVHESQKHKVSLQLRGYHLSVRYTALAALLCKVGSQDKTYLITASSQKLEIIKMRELNAAMDNTCEKWSGKDLLGESWISSSQRLHLEFPSRSSFGKS